MSFCLATLALSLGPCRPPCTARLCAALDRERVCERKPERSERLLITSHTVKISHLERVGWGCNGAERKICAVVGQLGGVSAVRDLSACPGGAFNGRCAAIPITFLHPTSAWLTVSHWRASYAAGEFDLRETLPWCRCAPVNGGHLLTWMLRI